MEKEATEITFKTDGISIKFGRYVGVTGGVTINLATGLTLHENMKVGEVLPLYSVQLKKHQMH